MALLDSIKSFLVEKFWIPITDESVFYNPFNTTAYAILFGLAAAYIGKPAMKKLDLFPDRNFWIALAPFVFLGGAVRSLKDADIVNMILLETPFIYLLMFGVVAATLYSSRKFEEQLGIEYHKTMLGVGVLLVVSTLSLFQYPDLGLFPPIAIIFSILTITTFVAAKYFKPEVSAMDFVIPVSAHWFDASTSYVALAFDGAAEKHVLAQFFIESFGPEGMFLLKAVIIIPAVYYIGEEIEGFDKKYYLFLIAVLGFALGARNLVSTIVL